MCPSGQVMNESDKEENVKLSGRFYPFLGPFSRALRLFGCSWADVMDDDVNKYDPDPGEMAPHNTPTKSGKTELPVGKGGVCVSPKGVKERQGEVRSIPAHMRGPKTGGRPIRGETIQQQSPRVTRVSRTFRSYTFHPNTMLFLCACLGSLCRGSLMSHTFVFRLRTLYLGRGSRKEKRRLRRRR